MMLIALLLYAIGSFIKFLFRMFVMLVGTICICLSSFDIFMIVRLLVRGVEVESPVLSLTGCIAVFAFGIVCFTYLISRNKNS